MMLNELHKRGYQHLRLLCGMSPNGCAWRWMIYPKLLMRNNARIERKNDTLPFDCPHGSTGSERSNIDFYEMADAFIDKYRSFVDLGKQTDSKYVDWFANIVEHAQRNIFPIAFADFFRADEWEFTDNESLSFPPFEPADSKMISDEVLIDFALEYFDEFSSSELKTVLDFKGLKPTNQEIAIIIRQAINEEKGLISHVDDACWQVMEYKSDDIIKRDDFEGKIHLVLKNGEEIFLEDRIDLFAWSSPSPNT